MVFRALGGLTLRVCRGIFSFLRRRWPELFVFLFGVLLRLSLISNFDYRWGYDSEAHWQVIDWMVHFRTAPNTETLFEAYHPPLFYGLAAWLIDHGWTRPMLKAIPISCGLVRLVLTWIGLELYLPRFRWARFSALALAAVLPVSIHMDGMIFAEGLSCLFHLIAILLIPLAFRREGLPRIHLTVWLGFLMGLALLTKISALIMLAALGLTVVFEFFLSRRPLRYRLGRAWPWLGTVAIVVAMGSWYFAQNVRQYDKPIVASFDLPADAWRIAPALRKPVLDRRTVGYVIGWGDEIFKYPYFPSGLAGRFRFFPTLLATAVVDYWDFGFSGFDRTKPETPNPPMVHPWFNPESSRAAIMGGFIVMLATLAAWVVALVRTLKNRQMGYVALLLLPFFAVLGALQFAVSFPADHNGIIKATYLMFAAPPLFALFGLAVEWTVRSPLRWPAFALLMASLLALGWYSTLSRISRYYPWEIPKVQASMSFDSEATSEMGTPT
jgi:hypothetical protein